MKNKQATPVPECWRPAKGLEGFYEVSDLGRLRRIAPGKNAKIGSIRRLSVAPNGYASATVFLGDKTPRTVHLHRLVALTFLGDPPPGKPQVNHKNGVKTDNRASNLEWVSQSENMRHAQSALGWKGRPGCPVLQLDYTGRIITRFDSAKAAADSIDGRRSTRSCISTVCSSFHRRAFRKVFYRDFIWVLESDYTPEIVRQALNNLQFMRSSHYRRSYGTNSDKPRVLQG